MLNQKHLENILAQVKVVEAKKLQSIKQEAQEKNYSLEEYLLEQKIIPENLLYETAASYYNVPFVSLKNQVIRKDILMLIPEPIAQTHSLVAYEKTDKGLKIACLDPEDLETFEFIKKRTGLNLIINLTTPSDINETIKNYHKSLKAEFQDITKKKETKDEKGKKALKELAEDLPIVRIVDTLLEYAIFESASDIHIEPGEKEVVIRYRIDGILRKVMTLPKTVHSGVAARIKILSNLKVDEHRLPQDGRFKIQTTEYKVAFRVSIMPAYDGEKIVLRLLNEKAQILSLEQLGLQKKSLEQVKTALKKPHGMILVTGPTGSGKTTTLYTVLNILNTPKVNISTIEDPIEYRMQNVNQSQVNPKIGFTFALGLRAFLRQDPDIIMVGEIRDEETAGIAVHAAMTGHLVLSTLHTNDAITTLPRLSEMKIPPYLVASTTNIVIAQRLVRKICTGCIQSYNLDKSTIKDLEQQLNIEGLLKRLESEGAIMSAEQKLNSLLFYKGKGCKQCNNQGYKGRIGIYETLLIDKDISELILQKATKQQIYDKARAKGMLSLQEDGFIKAKNGITTIEEILRVTKD